MSGGANPLAEDLLRRVTGGPEVCVHSLDLARDVALLVELSAATQREASFLDDRVIKPGAKGAWVELGRVMQAAFDIRAQQPLHFIFHTGHVGSTLISRLLDEARTVFPLREPGVLRQLAEIIDVVGRIDSLINERSASMLLNGFLRLWARGDAATKAVVLKATSSTGRIAPTLLAQQPLARAIYLNVRAEPYITTLLAGRNSAIDLRGHGPERFRRLANYGAVMQPLHELSGGELAAASWLAETWSQHKALDAHGERVLFVDFDAFLGNVTEQTERIVTHLGLPHEPGFLSGISKSPVLTYYAKAPEHPYSAETRAQILREARTQQAAEIRKGLAWLDKLGAANADVAAMCGRAGR